MQLRAVWFAIRPVAVTAALVAAAVTILVFLLAVRGGESFRAAPQMVYLAALAGALLPIAVWKGEYDFRYSYLASMPVDRSLHVLAKVGAGWVWLMIAVGAFLLWVVGLAVFTGGEIGDDVLRVLASTLPPGTPAEAAPAFATRWTTPAWQWATFFGASTAAYLAGSAVVLAGPQVRRTLAGLVAAGVFLLLAEDEELLGGLTAGLMWIVRLVMVSRYGLMNLFAATEAHYLANDAGEQVVAVWDEPPVLAAWLAATLVWTGVTAACLVAVVWRGRRS